MKCYKKLLIGIGLAAFAWLSYKSSQLIMSIQGLSKDLPEFFKNSYGDRPKLSMTIIFKRCKIVLSFRKETLEKNPDLEEKVYEYIDRFYPEISNLKLTVIVDEKVDTVEDDLEDINETDEESELIAEIVDKEIELEETE